MIKTKFITNNQTTKIQEELDRFFDRFNYRHWKLISVQSGVSDSSNSRVYTILIVYEVTI